MVGAPFLCLALLAIRATSCAVAISQLGHNHQSASNTATLALPKFSARRKETNALWRRSVWAVGALSSAKCISGSVFGFVTCVRILLPGGGGKFEDKGLFVVAAPIVWQGCIPPRIVERSVSSGSTLAGMVPHPACRLGDARDLTSPERGSGVGVSQSNVLPQASLIGHGYHFCYPCRARRCL